MYISTDPNTFENSTNQPSEASPNVASHHSPVDSTSEEPSSLQPTSNNSSPPASVPVQVTLPPQNYTSQQFQLPTVQSTSQVRHQFNYPTLSSPFPQQPGISPGSSGNTLLNTLPNQFQYQTPFDLDKRCALYMSDIDPWVDEEILQQIWMSLGYKVFIKLGQNRSPTLINNYAILFFPTIQEARKALFEQQGAVIHGSRKVFKLNWAFANPLGPQPPLTNPTPNPEREEGVTEHSIFVGDLSDGIDDVILLNTFRSRYSTAKAAKVVVDSATGRSRGYGFVRFGSEVERTNALNEMPGTVVMGRPIRVSYATPRSRSTRDYTIDNQARVPSPQVTGGVGIGYVDTSITTVFVGNLSSMATESDLRNCFQIYGEIDHIKIPAGKGCGFVQFASRQQAEAALDNLNGVQIGGKNIRLSWGRLPADRTAQQKVNRPVPYSNNFTEPPHTHSMLHDDNMFQFGTDRAQWFSNPTHPSYLPFSSSQSNPIDDELSASMMSMGFSRNSPYQRLSSSASGSPTSFNPNPFQRRQPFHDQGSRHPFNQP